MRRHSRCMGKGCCSRGRIRLEKGDNNVNHCLFGGRFVDDPQILVSKSGITYTRFTMAVNDRVFDKTENKWVDKANFIPCMAYGDVAKYIVDKGRKGYKVNIVARADQTTYKKDRNSPMKKELVFTAIEAEVESREEKWHSKQWF